MLNTLPALGLIDELQRHAALVEGMPDPLADAERRSQIRYETLSDPIELELVAADGTTAPALLADISATGARLIADRLPPDAQTVCLKFDIGDRQVAIFAEVIHCGDQNEEHYFGVRFVTTPEFGRALPRVPALTAI